MMFLALILDNIKYINFKWKFKERRANPKQQKNKYLHSVPVLNTTNIISINIINTIQKLLTKLRNKMIIIKFIKTMNFKRQLY